MRSGKLGRVKVARGFCYKPRMSIGRTTGPQAVPDYINYDLWCGPAPLTPPRRNNPKFGPVHYDWHWFWAYGGGDLGNQGIHQVDICRWLLGEPKLAPFVLSVGGRLGYVDDAETPNTMVLYQGYAKAPLVFEVRGLPKNKDAQAAGWEKNMDAYRDVRIGCVIECEGGSVVVPSYTDALVYDKDGKLLRKFETKDRELAGRLGLAAGSGDHHGNWIAAIRSRKPSLLTAPILEGHISSALCHTANISYRVGTRRQPGEIKEALQDNKLLAEAYDRMAAHLDANGVDVTKDLVTLGVPLRLDPNKERFIGNDAANRLLKREYRPPFVVPEEV
ncbi:MAG: hypothetical protein N2689_07430 [Verrucomicrobiae bacterium]|nr:hypothetical protein [Verrucomicrobiae bacterium]